MNKERYRWERKRVRQLGIKESESTYVVKKVFWDTTMCLVSTNVLEEPAASIFKVLEVYCVLKMEAADCSETLVRLNITPHIITSQKFYTHRLKNLESPIKTLQVCFHWNTTPISGHV
jgi:hypothetical protein